MKRLLLVLPLAGCPHHGGTTPSGKGEVYAGMFEPQRSWTYEVVETPEDGAAPSTYEVTCGVSETIDVDGGRLSMITCDGTLGEGMQEAVAGMWAEDARGVFYLPELVPDGDLAGPLPVGEMVDYRLMLPPTPKAGPVPIHDAQGGEVGHLTIESTAEGWCRSDRRDDDSSWTRVCFTDGGITSGQLGWGGSVHAVSFTESE